MTHKSNITPDEAIKRLQDGNARYLAGDPIRANLDQDRRTLTAKGQSPYATFLSCADSRVPVELLCDAGIGELFLVRNAGNVLGANELGSIEYSLDHLGAPVFVIMGHSKCGAVKAVYDAGILEGNLQGISEKILPAVREIKENPPKGLTAEQLVDEAAKVNLWNAIQDAFKGSEIVRRKVKSGDLKVLGAFYDIESGEIDWMGPHPNQDSLLD